jgi:hypothetical protein
MRSQLLTAVATVLLVAGAAGCAGPPGSRSESPSPLPDATASPVATASSIGSASPTSTARSADDWQPIGEPAPFRAGTIRRILTVRTGFVAVGCTGLVDECAAPAIWTSVDGLAWSAPTTLPMLPGETARSATAAVVVSGAIVIGGEVGRADRIRAALWVAAAAGGPFERVPDVPSFGDGSVGHLLAVAGGLVAVGSDAYMEYAGFRAWHSVDGLAWVPTVPQWDDQASPTGVVGVEGGLVAWGPTCSVCPAETAFWRSADGSSWSDGRRELDGEFAFASTIGVTDGGLVAFGTIGVDPTNPAAWSLANGTERWVPIDPPPQPGRVSVRSHLAVGHGAVLAGTSLAGDRPTGLIWLSGPGETGWRPPMALPGVAVMGMLRDPTRPERLILVGETLTGDRPSVGLWVGSVDWAP